MGDSYIKIKTQIDNSDLYSGIGSLEQRLKSLASEKREIKLEIGNYKQIAESVFGLRDTLRKISGLTISGNVSEILGALGKRSQEASDEMLKLADRKRALETQLRVKLPPLVDDAQLSKYDSLNKEYETLKSALTGIEEAQKRVNETWEKANANPIHENWQEYEAARNSLDAIFKSLPAGITSVDDIKGRLSEIESAFARTGVDIKAQMDKVWRDVYSSMDNLTTLMKDDGLDFKSFGDKWDSLDDKLESLDGKTGQELIDGVISLRTEAAALNKEMMSSAIDQYSAKMASVSAEMVAADTASEQIKNNISTWSEASGIDKGSITFEDLRKTAVDAKGKVEELNVSLQDVKKEQKEAFIAINDAFRQEEESAGRDVNNPLELASGFLKGGSQFYRDFAKEVIKQKEQEAKAAEKAAERERALTQTEESKYRVLERQTEERGKQAQLNHDLRQQEASSAEESKLRVLEKQTEEKNKQLQSAHEIKQAEMTSAEESRVRVLEKQTEEKNKQLQASHELRQQEMTSSEESKLRVLERQTEERNKQVQFAHEARQEELSSAEESKLRVLEKQTEEKNKQVQYSHDLKKQEAASAEESKLRVLERQTEEKNRQAQFSHELRQQESESSEESKLRVLEKQTEEKNKQVQFAHDTKQQEKVADEESKLRVLEKQTEEKNKQLQLAHEQKMAEMASADDIKSRQLTDRTNAQKELIDYRNSAKFVQSLPTTISKGVDALAGFVAKVIKGYLSIGVAAVKTGAKVSAVFGKKMFTGLLEGFKGAISLGKKASKVFLDVSKSLLGINVIKSIGSSIGGLLSRIGKLAAGALIFRAMSTAFRQLRKDIVETFSTYLNYDSTLNSSVNTLKANFSTLKAQLASAFAPILQIIVPALSTFVGWCVTATNAVSAFIAALTGQSTWKKAVVNSVGAVGDAASGAADDLSDAADKADELKEKLGSYDKLNVIDDESSPSKSGKGSGGGGGSGAASGAGISYEDVKIGDEIANLADKIKEMWKNADFTELGGMVGDYLKNALDSIKWGPIKDAAYKVGSSVATFLNGFFETPGLAQSIGRTLGETLNTGISLAEGFVQNFHWDSFGTFLKDGINTMVDTVEWERAGGVVRDGMDGIITAFNKLTDPTDGVDFFKLGNSIGTFITTALDLNWDDLQTAFKNTGIAFGEFVNGLSSAGTLTSIGTLIGNFFKGIATSVSNFINTTNFAQLGRDVGGGVKAIGDGISQGLDELTQLDLSGKLDEFFTNFFNTVTEEDFKKWGTSLGGFLGHSLSELITTIHHWMPIVCANIGVFIDAMINAFAGQMTADKFKELGETLSSFVSGAVGKIGEWLDKPENANGIALRLKGFLDGLTEGWDPESFHKLGAGIRRVLFKIIQVIRQWAIDEGNIKMAVRSLKLFFVGLFDANGDGQISFSEIKEFVDTIFGLLLDAIKEVFDGDKAVGALALFFLVLKSGIIKKIAMIGLAKSIGKSIVGGAAKEITAKGLLSGLSSSSVEAAALPIGTALAAAIIGAATGEWTRKEGLWLKGSDKEVYDALTSVTGKRGGKKDKIAKDIATTLSGEAGYTDEVYGSMSRVWQAIARAQESIDPAKWGDLKQALVDLRESGTLATDAAEDVDYWITRLDTDSNMVSISVDGFNKSISESAVEADKSKVSYKNISDAVDYLKTSAGFSGDALSDLDYILNRNDVDAATKYQMIDEILRKSGEDGEKFSNIFKNYVNAELKNVAENINKIETTDLHKKLDELASSGKISYDELWRLKGLTEHQIGRDAFTTLIEQLGMSAENADALKELIASQLGIEIGKLGENADLVAGTLNELLNPDGTEEGQTKVDGILDLLGIKLDNMADKDATVEVKGDTTDVDEKLTSTEEKADEVDGKTVTIVEEADSTGVEEEFVALDSSVEERDGETVTIKVDGTAEDLRTLLENTETDINLFKNTDGEVVIEFNGVSYAFDATSEEVKAVIAEYEGKTATTEFVGDNQVGAAVKAANDDADTVVDEKVITFKGNDEVSQEADNVTTKMNETPSEKQISFVNVGGALLATFITTVLSLALASIPDEKKITFTVDNQTEEPIGAIKTSLSEVQNHMSNVVAPALKQDFQTVFSAARGYANQALTGGGGITSAISFMQSDIRNKLGAIPGMFQTVFESARQTAVNAIQAIQSAINGLTGKKVYVTVDENGTVAWVKRIIDTIPDSHTVTIYANWVGDTDRSFYATVYWENVNRAIGGILRNGIWQNLPSYAGGTAKAHGTIFRAGEAGAEIVGNVNGRTEVLNKSQIASAIYSAVKSAMAEGLTEVGNALISNIIGAANSINMNLGHLITEYQSQNSVEAYRLAFAGLDDIGALSSYKSTEGGFGSWDLNDLKDALSGDFYINNEMTLDGKVIYKEMVTLDRQAVRLTGRSGFGGR